MCSGILFVGLTVAILGGDLSRGAQSLRADMVDSFKLGALSLGVLITRALLFGV